MGPKSFLVGGHWRTSERIKPVINPYTQVSAGEVYQADHADIAEAIRSAAGAFETSRGLAAHVRSSILSAIAEGVRGRREEFARMITDETGKPITFARAEVDRCVFTFTASAEEAKRQEGSTLPLDLAAGSEGRFGIVRRFPLGPVAAITPFNFPLNLVAHKVGPALAAGNTVVLKPSSNAPGVALLLAEVIEKSGWISGGFNVVPCASDEASQLVENGAIKLLSFTGSPAVGWQLKSRAGKKKVVLELGGNAGVIVDESADIADAVPRIVQGGFGNAGQSCISVQRVFVHDRISARFEELFLQAVRALIVGNPLDENTVVGPMIDEAAAVKVEGWITEAKNAGATVVCGGGRKGAVMEPTVLRDVPSGLHVCTEEVFAPLVVIQTFTEFGDAVRAVNNSRYGLQAGVFSNNLANVLAAYRDLDVGGIVVNDSSSYRMDHMPYGGVKDSGFGREGVRYAIEEMTEPKLLCLRGM